jgi:hypothetical protein
MPDPLHSELVERKPCPFCASTNLEGVACDGRQWLVCRDCGADGPIASNDDEMMSLWNKRTDLIERLTSAPAGYAIVPVEPTEAMLAAAGEVNFDNEDERAMACNVWNAMISAQSMPVAGRKVEHALIRLEAAATLVTEWLDRINGRDGTSLGGPQWFELGRAVAKAREALSTAPSPSPVSGCRVCGAAIPSAELCDGCAQGNDPFQQSKYGESRA